MLDYETVSPNNSFLNVFKIVEYLDIVMVFDQRRIC